MNVASLELCKELYELSGWETELWYVKSSRGGVQLKDSGHVPSSKVMELSSNEFTPAYDLGYLMRKLPSTLHHLSEDPADGLWLVLSAGDEAKHWVAGYGNENPHNQIEVEAATPEDAACRLAIELFRQHILVATNPEK